MRRIAPLSVLVLVLVLVLDPAHAEDASPAAPAPPTGTARPAPEQSPADRARREIARLRSPDAAEREAAARALVEIGAPALEPILVELGAATELAGRLRALAIEIDPTARPEPLVSGERWYEAKLREASLRMRRGDHLAAWKLLDAILVVEPDCPIRDRIQAMKLRARELYVRASVLAGRIVPKKVLVAPGEKIELAIEAKNVSEQPLELSFDAERGEVFGAVEVEIYRATRHGDTMRSREKRNVQAAAAARLAPGETWRTPLVLPPLERAHREIFRRVTISGALRPAVLRRGDDQYNAPIPLFPVDVVVVDPEFHALAADPVASVRKALADVRGARDGRAHEAAAERLFFAAMIGGSTARDATIDAVAGAIEREDDLALEPALAALSGLADRRLDRLAALEWLRRRRGP